jgi:hypothetical protein
MTDPESSGAAKIHPTAREILPDDPMEMTGFEVPGDTDLMLRLLVEEYARIGWGFDEIMGLARDPNYQAFHGLLQLYGEARLGARVREILSRCGIMRVKTTETEPISDRLVQIEIK